MTTPARNHLQYFDMVGVPLVEIEAEPSRKPLRKGWPAYELGPGELDAILADPTRGLGVKLGGASGLIDIEGDGPGAEAEWQRITAGLDIPDTCGWRSSRGIHRLFRVTEPAWPLIGTGVLKIGDLELRFGAPDRYSLQSVIPPHAGREWMGPEQPAKLPYQLALRLQAERHQHETREPRVVEDSNVNRDSPGYIFGESVTWGELLTQYGWTETGSGSEGQPQYKHKNANQDVSATLNYKETDKLYCFSNNAFGSGYTGSLDKFMFYAEENFSLGAGRLPDFREAARDLVKQGHVKDAVGQFDFLDVDVVEPTPVDTSVPTELLLFPGLVANFAELHAKRSSRYDLRAGAVTGMLLQSWMMGQRVALADGTRPNIYIMYLSPTGFGKTAAIDSAKRLLGECGHDEALYSRFKSWQAMEEQLAGCPNMMIVQEELQDYLEAMLGRGDAPKKEFISFIKELSTESKTFHRCRTARTSDGGAGEIVDQPHVSLLMTGVTEAAWSCMSLSLMEGGVLGRFTIFEGPVKGSINEQPADDAFLRSDLLEHMTCWRMREVKRGEPAEPREPGQVTQGKLIVDTIVRDDGADALALAFQKECDRNHQQCADDKSVGAAAWSRAHEAMCRFELLIAGSANAVDCRVSITQTQWAIDLVRQSIIYKVARMEDQGPRDEDFEQHCGKVLQALIRFAKAGTKVVTSRMLQRRTKIRVARLGELVFYLTDQGDVVSNGEMYMDGLRVRVAPTKICLRKNREFFKK